MSQFMWFLPTRIVFGPGGLEELGKTPHLPGRKAMVVVGSSGAMARHGVLERVQYLLRRNGVTSTVFDRVHPNPTSDQIEDGADVFRRSGSDFTVGLGGGSCIDAAKSIAFLAANSGRYWDYMERGSGGRRPVEQPAHPIVAIPTTAGTGSEADPWTVVSKSGGSEKAGWGHESTFPRLAIVDPELTLSLPPDQTAFTGLDALFHAVEAVLSRAAQPLTDLLALDAVERISRSLPGAVANGADLDLRSDMSLAALQAGVCEALTGVISLHAMGLSLGGLFPSLAHGEALVLLAPAYFCFLERRLPKRFARLSAALQGQAGTGRDPGIPFTFLLEQLIAACGAAAGRLEDRGVGPGDIPALTANTFACAGAHFERTPVPMSAGDVAAVFRAALDRTGQGRRCGG